MDWDFMYIYAKKELKLSDEEFFTMSLGRFFDLCDTVNEINNPTGTETQEDVFVEDDNAKRSVLKSMIG